MQHFCENGIKCRNPSREPTLLKGRSIERRVCSYCLKSGDKPATGGKAGRELGSDQALDYGAERSSGGRRGEGKREAAPSRSAPRDVPMGLGVSFLTASQDLDDTPLENEGVIAGLTVAGERVRDNIRDFLRSNRISEKSKAELRSFVSTIQSPDHADLLVGAEVSSGLLRVSHAMEGIEEVNHVKFSYDPTVRNLQAEVKRGNLLIKANKVFMSLLDEEGTSTVIRHEYTHHAAGHSALLRRLIARYPWHDGIEEAANVALDIVTNEKIGRSRISLGRDVSPRKLFLAAALHGEWLKEDGDGSLYLSMWTVERAKAELGVDLARDEAPEDMMLKLLPYFGKAASRSKR